MENNQLTIFDVLPNTDHSIEIAFDDLLRAHMMREKRDKNATGIENVLQFLLDHPEKIWWFSWEFIGKTNSKDGWLSHRAPARASDLAIHYPHLVEDRKISRFSVYRLRTENMAQIREFLQ